MAAALAAALLCAGPGNVTHAQDPEPPATEAEAPGIEQGEGAASSAEVQAALTIAEHLIAAGRPVEAFAVLLEITDMLPEGTDDTPLRFAIAQALMAGGRLGQAEQVLARLADEHPDNLRVRLDHAAVLFALERDDEAGTHFREIRRAPDLPPDTRSKVENFLASILARQRLRFDLDLGLWYDTNVNFAPQAATVTIPAFGNLPFRLDQRPIGAWVARTGGRVRWRKPVTTDGRVLFQTSAWAARNTAIGADEYSQTWLNLLAGPRLGYTVPFAGRDRPGWLAADLGLARRWWGNRGFATTLSAQFQVDQALDVNWRVGFAPRVWGRFHDGQPRAVDPVGYSLNLSASRRAGPGWLTLSGTLSHEIPGRRSLDWRSEGLNLQYAANVGAHWNGSVWVGLNWTRFATEDPTFLRRRKDRTPMAGLTLSHRKLSWNGYMPVLTVDWSRNASNIPLYERKLFSVRLGLQRLF